MIHWKLLSYFDSVSARWGWENEEIVGVGCSGLCLRSGRDLGQGFCFEWNKIGSGSGGYRTACLRQPIWALLSAPCMVNWLRDNPLGKRQCGVDEVRGEVEKRGSSNWVRIFCKNNVVFPNRLWKRTLHILCTLGLDLSDWRLGLTNTIIETLSSVKDKKCLE